jgi:glycosyltransferase involved in cell wall biosynthesis
MSNSNENALVILAPFASVPGESKFNRFYLLAELFSENKKVTLITSDFNHNDKKHNRSKNYRVNDSFNIICLHELGYKNNISIKRFVSHLFFTYNFLLFILKNKRIFKNSLILAAYPLIFPLFILSVFKNKYNYKFIVDINDIWPQAFGHLLPKFGRPILNSKIVNYLSAYIFLKADVIMSVSKTYLEHGIKSNPMAHSYVLYLGSDKGQINRNSSIVTDLKEEVHFAYIGALGTSYDLETCIRGFKTLSNYKNREIYFHIFGDGPNRKYLESISGNNVFFHGFKEYSVMLNCVKNANFLVNPIKDGAAQSITNKLSDYIMLQKPVISSQNSDEIESLYSFESYHLYNAGDVNDFIDKLKRIINESKIVNFNSETINLFDRNLSYPKFVNWLNELRIN